MKQITFTNSWATLSFLTILMFNTSCKDDPDDMVMEPLVYEIEGEWKMSALEFSNEGSGSIFGIPFEQSSEGTASDMDVTVMFKSDNTFTAVGTYTLDIDITATALGMNETTTAAVPVIFTDVAGTYTLDKPDLMVMKDTGTITTEDPDVEAPGLIVGTSVVVITENKLVVTVTTSNESADQSESSFSKTTFDRQ